MASLTWQAESGRPCAALERATGASLATQKILGLKLFKGTGVGASKGAVGTDG
jgi:hypothetical protein